MELRNAQNVCFKIDSMYRGQIKWNDVFASEEEMIEALRNVYIPKNRTAPVSTFIGYDFIYSFAFYVQKGWKLSEKQITQCKRLAKEIKKASAIADYKF